MGGVVSASSVLRQILRARGTRDLEAGGEGDGFRRRRGPCSLGSVLVLGRPTPAFINLSLPESAGAVLADFSRWPAVAIVS